MSAFWLRLVLWNFPYKTKLSLLISKLASLRTSWETLGMSVYSGYWGEHFETHLFGLPIRTLARSKSYVKPTCVILTFDAWFTFNFTELICLKNLEIWKFHGDDNLKRHIFSVHERTKNYSRKFCPDFFPKNSAKIKYLTMEEFREESSASTDENVESLLFVKIRVCFLRQIILITFRAFLKT